MLINKDSIHQNQSEADKISIIIPVYKTAKSLDKIVNILSKDNYKNKEIRVVIDGELTPDIDKTLKELKGKITLFHCSEHLGKAQALNEASLNLKTDILLFLDNDIILPEDPHFLTDLVKEMKTHDIVEMPKEVQTKCFFSAMISYEYLSNAIACLTFSNIAKRSPAVIGSAFAVKKTLFKKLKGFRRVVHEDGDFGARAFNENAKYAYPPRFKVKNSMPNNARNWWKQRKRWSLLNVLWLKDNIRMLAKNMFKQPNIFSAILLLAVPMLLSFIIVVIFNFFHITYIMPTILILGHSFNFLSGILFLYTHYSLLTHGLLSLLLGLSISSLTYWILSLIVKFRFNLIEYMVYFLVYFPILVIINTIMFTKVLIFKRKIAVDWMV